MYPTETFAFSCSECEYLTKSICLRYSAFFLFVCLSLQLDYKPKDKYGFSLFFFPALTQNFTDDTQMQSVQMTGGSLFMRNWFTVTCAEEIV